jgi:hypothetical protein
MKPPVAWALLGCVALAKLAVHLVSNGPLDYGHMSDELYYLACADRLAWGYVDHPPLSIVLLWIQRAALGDSVLALRLLPTLAGCATILLAGLMARELGGGRTAQGLAALAALVAPVYLAVSGGFYSMNAFDPAIWGLCYFLLLRLLRDGDRRLWLALGLVMGLALLNKISMLWFGVGLGVGLVATSSRAWLRTPWPWLSAGIAFAIFAPYVVWEVRHGWPTLEFMQNAMRYKMPDKSVFAFLGEQVLMMHPFVVPLWGAGLVYLFGAESARPVRLVGWIWLTVFLVLLGSGTARANYIAPAYSVLLAAGGVAVERFVRARAWPWLPRIAAALLVVGGVVTLPMAIPILPPARYVAYERAIGISPPKEELTEFGALPLHFALRFGWPAYTRSVARAYEALPAEDRSRAGILVQTFGEAGAIDFYGREFGLPRAIGTQNNYWLWGPGEYTGEVMIVVSESEAQLHEYCREVEWLAEIDCEYCMPDLDAKSVYLCRQSQRPLREIWPELKNFI